MRCRFLKLVLDIDQSHYPERVRGIFIVNAPPTILGPWKLVSFSLVVFIIMHECLPLLLPTLSHAFRCLLPPTYPIHTPSLPSDQLMAFPCSRIENSVHPRSVTAGSHSSLAKASSSWMCCAEPLTFLQHRQRRRNASAAEQHERFPRCLRRVVLQAASSSSNHATLASAGEKAPRHAHARCFTLKKKQHLMNKISISSRFRNTLLCGSQLDPADVMSSSY